MPYSNSDCSKRAEAIKRKRQQWDDLQWAVHYRANYGYYPLSRNRMQELAQCPSIHSLTLLDLAILQSYLSEKPGESEKKSSGSRSKAKAAKSSTKCSTTRGSTARKSSART